MPVSNPNGAYTEHTAVKPEKLVETAVQFLEQELTLPNLMHKESFDAYRGAKDDTVNVKVEGVLPFHEYEFRNDRSEPIKRDVYAEKTVAVQLAGHFYSNVALTEEQIEWDLLDWGKMLQKQARAVSRGLQRQAASTIENAPYEVVIGGAERNFTGAFTEARRIFNRFQVPGTRFVVVGSDFEAALQNDPNINLAKNVGDSRAESALADATLGKIKDFTFILDNTIDPETAYAFVDGGFVWANAAPIVPRSVGYGATTSYEGVSLRLVQNYVHSYIEDQQLVDTWSGMRVNKDFLLGWDSENGVEKPTEDAHFVRGIKLTLGGESAYPTGELADLTGVSEARKWENGSYGDTDGDAPAAG